MWPTSWKIFPNGESVILGKHVVIMSEKIKQTWEGIHGRWHPRLRLRGRKRRKSRVFTVQNDRVGKEYGSESSQRGETERPLLWGIYSEEAGKGIRGRNVRSWVLLRRWSQKLYAKDQWSEQWIWENYSDMTSWILFEIVVESTEPKMYR